MEKIFNQDTALPALCQTLENNASLLEKALPESFSRIFTPDAAAAVLSMTAGLPSTGPVERRSSISGQIVRLAFNPETTETNTDASYTAAVLCESSGALPCGRALRVEAYLQKETNTAAPVFPEEELAKAFPGGVWDAEVANLYSRLNWNALSECSAACVAKCMALALSVQNVSRAECTVCKKDGGFIQMIAAAPDTADGCCYFDRIADAAALFGFRVEEAERFVFSKAVSDKDLNRQGVVLCCFLLAGDETKLDAFQDAVKTLYWTAESDLFHRELVLRKHFSVEDANLLRAGAEFIRSQFAFIDPDQYSASEIERLIAIHPETARVLADLFLARFNPANPDFSASPAAAEKAIASINSGIPKKDALARKIFSALLNMILNITKTNFFSGKKGALSFRLKPDFMNFYAEISPAYLKSFPPDRPFAVFYFFRNGSSGFQVRFSEIARGGWRTVIPRAGANLLEKDDFFNAARNEYFREVYVLAHTQHMKNKDIYEGGAKMLTLLHTALGRDAVKPTLWESQKAVFEAFLSLINYDETGKLRDKAIADNTGAKEIIEIGPDENMFDAMIEYMGEFAEKAGYTLGAGLISGKPDRGINHKEFGVTSFGVHQYLLRMMRFLGINPAKDDYSVKISGGPGGDVAGNLVKLLLKKENGAWAYPNQRIIAITDGPAAVYDPAGIDRDELARIVLKENLDSFNPEKLHGENAYIIYSKPETADGTEFHRQVLRRNGKNEEVRLTRDEFMRIFQNNLCHYADILLPCGGRPSTINIDNWADFLPKGGDTGMRAIVEGANSFITPDARIKLQENGIPIIKDASANKCGVITSSYEIMSGLMLDEAEFKAEKNVLVPQVKEKLAFNAAREAEWLFATKEKTGKFLTDLTETLSRAINAKNAQIFEYFSAHPEKVSGKVIFAHLPVMFREKYSGRLNRIPDEYRRAIAAVELAARIVYNSLEKDNLESEIEAAEKFVQA